MRSFPRKIIFRCATRTRIRKTCNPVDVSASRRLDMALRNVALAAIMGAFDKKKTLPEALADEIEFTAKGDANTSYAIKKRDETERMARSSR